MTTFCDYLMTPLEPPATIARSRPSFVTYLPHILSVWKGIKERVRERKMRFNKSRLHKLPQTIYWKRPISILGMSGYTDMAKLFANSGDSDQMPHSAASDLGLHCSPITLFGVSKLKQVGKDLAATVCYVDNV